MRKIYLLTIILCLIPMTSFTSNHFENQIEAIKSLSSSDLAFHNVLIDAINKKIEQSNKQTYNNKVKDGIENILSKNASRYWLVFDFIALYGNGGMQMVILTSPEELPFKKWQLRKTVEAFSYYKCHELAGFFENLIPKSIEWSNAIEALNKREDAGETIPEAEFQKIWDMVDSNDEPFYKLLEKKNIFEEIYKDIQKAPETYLQQLP